ncbi:glycosyltransferase [Paenibacillus ehimensis]|uniref:Glycosyltransferase n=1 Tax=Paenibacillus ehimensis TaxID=79264 RepID=A0ABT8VCY7_9BACL|nr:glycosyltransferase [Paenibacillus ehimensis]MDO3678808.1 glycosyltransferase [Paenibacillus ehimensis]MEC0209445.1 glycosyltransferase [Paenibacillus ehimensis]
MKNSNKICFITCYNDEVLYQECLKYIHTLKVPEGFAIETLGIVGAESMAAGYNKAMHSSDAKYKVYLHQDTFIINKSFISDVLTLFHDNPQVGLLGMAGAIEIPTNAVWWEASDKVGQVYESHSGKMNLLSFGEVTTDHTVVAAIDGFIMITQYDISWRDDLFNGWHFYDLSQSTEFVKAGFEVAVPKQNKPWCIHDCGIVDVSNGFNHFKNIFLEEYSKFLFPKVSILIPTCNRPHYLELALKSALAQSYPHIEVIISDDSEDDISQSVVEPYLEAYPHLKYYKNKKEKWLGNFQNLLELSSGKYIAFLADDDLFHPNKVEKMTFYLSHFKEVTLVTSHRQLIDENGRELHPIPATRKLFEVDTFIDGIELGNFVLSNCLNVIGEASTVMFRKNDLRERIGFYRGKNSIMGDISSWISLLSLGKAVYIAETLNYFRMHKEQIGQNSSKTLVPAIKDWLTLINDSREDGFLKDDIQYKKALTSYLRQSINYLELLYQSNDKVTIENFGLYDSFDFALRDLTCP